MCYVYCYVGQDLVGVVGEQGDYVYGFIVIGWFVQDQVVYYYGGIGCQQWMMWQLVQDYGLLGVVEFGVGDVGDIVQWGFVGQDVFVDFFV